MASDYILRPDGEFDAWQTNFVTYASANAAALGLDPVVDIPPLRAQGLIKERQRGFGHGRGQGRGHGHGGPPSD